MKNILVILGMLLIYPASFAQSGDRLVNEKLSVTYTGNTDGNHRGDCGKYTLSKALIRYLDRTKGYTIIENQNEAEFELAIQFECGKGYGIVRTTLMRKRPQDAAPFLAYYNTYTDSGTYRQEPYHNRAVSGVGIAGNKNAILYQLLQPMPSAHTATLWKH